MVVGVLKLNLILPENHSLKGKRGVLQRIRSRVSNQFNISITECGDQEFWQSTILGFGTVGSSQQVVNATLQNVVRFIDRLNLAQVGKAETEIFHC